MSLKFNRLKLSNRKRMPYKTMKFFKRIRGKVLRCNRPVNVDFILNRAAYAPIHGE